MIQTLFAIVGDIYLFRLTHRHFGAVAAKYAVYCQLLNWFYFYTCTRTLVTSVEAVLMVVALTHWPWCTAETFSSGTTTRSTTAIMAAPTTSQQLLSYIAAAICVLLRPPSLIFIGVLTLITLWLTPHAVQFRLAIPAGLMALGGCLVL